MSSKSSGSARTEAAANKNNTMGSVGKGSRHWKAESLANQINGREVKGSRTSWQEPSTPA